MAWKETQELQEKAHWCVHYSLPFIQQISLWVTSKATMRRWETVGKNQLKKKKERKRRKKLVSLHVRLPLQILFDCCGGQTLCSSGQWSWPPVSRLDLQVAVRPSPGKWQCRRPLRFEIAAQKRTWIKCHCTQKLAKFFLLSLKLKYMKAHFSETQD